MADVAQLNASSSDGIRAATIETTFSGSTGVHVQGVVVMGSSGAEGSRVATLIPGTSSQGLLVNIRGSTGVTVSPSSDVTIAPSSNVTVTPSSTMDVSLAGISSSLGISVLGLGSTGNAVSIGGTSSKGLDVYIRASDVASGGTSATDDAVFTVGTGTGTPAMGYASTGDNVELGDVGLFAMSSQRHLFVREQGTVTVSPSSNVTVTPSSDLTVIPSSTFEVHVSSSNTLSVSISSGSVTPSSNVTITPSSVYEVLVSSSRTFSVTVSSGSISPSSDLTVTPSSTMDVSVQEIIAGSNLIGDVGISGARTSGGATPYFLAPTSSQTGGAGAAPEVKTSAGQIYYLHAVNMSSEPLFLHLYAARSTGIVVGSTGVTPNHTFGIPAQADGNGAGFNLAVPNGITLSNGISYGVTKDIAHSSSIGSTGSATINLGYA